MNELEEPKTRGTEQTRPDKALNQELEFLWQDEAPSGNAYDVYLGRISRNPVVRSHVTGKYIMLPWSQLIDLAVRKGIDAKKNNSQSRTSSQASPLPRRLNSKPDPKSDTYWRWGINE